MDKNYSLQEFGSMVKTKYPEYAGYDDEDIGQRMLMKYPQYSSRVTVPEIEERPTQEGGVEGIAGVATGFAKSALNTLQNTGNLLVKPVYKAMGMGDVKTGIDSELLRPQGTAEKIGNFTGEVAQFALPASKVSKLTAGASRLVKTGGQVASDVAVNAAQQGSVGNSLTVGGTSAILSNIPLVGKLVSKKGEAVSSKMAKGLEEINLRLTPPQKTALKKMQNDVIGFLAKRKVTGSPEARYDKISVIVDEFEDKVQAALKESGKKYSKEEIINAVKNIPDTAADQVNNPEVLNQMVKNVDDFVKFVEGQKDDLIDAARVNQFKRGYAKNARNKAGDTVVNEAREAISDGLYSILQKDITNLKAINKPYSQALLAQKLLGKAIGRNQLGLIGNLMNIAAGTAAGGVMSGPVGTAVGGVVGQQVGKATFGTNTRSRLGAGFQTLSEYLSTAKTTSAGEFIIPKSIIESLMNDQ